VREGGDAPQCEEPAVRGVPTGSAYGEIADELGSQARESPGKGTTSLRADSGTGLAEVRQPVARVTGAKTSSLWPVCGPRSPRTPPERAKPRQDHGPDQGFRGGAGDGNRTRTVSLGTARTT